MIDKTFNEILDEYKNLSTIEKVFKYIYIKKIDYMTASKDETVTEMLKDSDNDAFVVNRILTNLYKESVLYEKQMFEPDENILVRMHTRYHPEISHSHDFFEIQYVLKGSFSQLIENNKFSLSAGDFCFISPNAKHTLYTFSDDVVIVNLLIKHEYFPKAFKFLSVSTDLLSAFFMNKLYSQDNKPFLINHSGDDERIKKLVARLISTSRDNTKYRSQIIRSQFEELFLYILQDHSENFDISFDDHDQQDKVVKVLTYIQNNYVNISLPELAENFGYNPSYLSRMIHEYTGKTFVQITRDFKFEHATNLLLNTDRTIESIVDEIGYTDRTCFYREFKSRYQMSPSEYRTRHI